MVDFYGKCRGKYYNIPYMDVMGFDSKKRLIQALGNRNLSSANGGARQQRHGMCLLNILCAADGAVAVQSKSAKKKES